MWWSRQRAAAAHFRPTSLALVMVVRLPARCWCSQGLLLVAEVEEEDTVVAVGEEVVRHAARKHAVNQQSSAALPEDVATAVSARHQVRTHALVGSQRSSEAHSSHSCAGSGQVVSHALPNPPSAWRCGSPTENLALLCLGGANGTRYRWPWSYICGEMCQKVTCLKQVTMVSYRCSIAHLQMP